MSVPRSSLPVSVPGSKDRDRTAFRAYKARLTPRVTLLAHQHAGAGAGVQEQRLSVKLGRPGLVQVQDQ